MKNIFVLPSFEHSVKKLSSQDKSKLARALEDFNSFLISGEAPFGFRFKKINHDKYEFRVDIRLRVVVRVENNNYCLILAGNHDDVRRYLRQYR